MMETRTRGATAWSLKALCVFAWAAAAAVGQLPDRTVTPNAAAAGIGQSLAGQIGVGRGDIYTPDSSAFIIARDPFRAIRRGRQLFQRKFTRAQGVGPLRNDGQGNIQTELAIGAGLADSCAACHGRPRGSAGFGGDVVTRPDSRDAPHLFGLGLKEMLADEMTRDLREIERNAQKLASLSPIGQTITLPLLTKGVDFGVISATRTAGGVQVDRNGVVGVNPDLRVRPFFAQGGTVSIREFAAGAFHAEMGLQAADPDLAAAAQGQNVLTPSRMWLSGSRDTLEAPPTADPNADLDGDGVANEIPSSLLDFMEFYLLNYFKPGIGETDAETLAGEQTFTQIGCATCHVQDLQVERDRRVADVETVYDPTNGIFNRLFATATPRLVAVYDGTGYPDIKRPSLQPFLVRNIFTDLKRHDLGPQFWERNYDGTYQKEFLTTPLWGVGSTAPYGHDGRSINLKEVILRHGGEAQAARDAFANLTAAQKSDILKFLNTLVLFPPDDTASNLNPGNPTLPNYPQEGHGSINLGALFNDPNVIE